MGIEESAADRAAVQMVIEVALQEQVGSPAGHFRHPAMFEATEVPVPLAAVRAARRLIHALQDQLRQHALLARGLGEDWEEVAEALELRSDGRPDASAAYLSTLGKRNDDPWWTPARGVLWTCTTCQEVVRDFGPDIGGPEDRESGHAHTCSRHTGEQMAWEALWS